MWDKAYGLETANTRGISPKPSEKCSLLIERKCEQICKCGRKKLLLRVLICRISSLLPEQSLRLCGASHKRNGLMYVDGGGGSRRESRYQRENLVRRFTALVKCFHCCPSRSSSSFKPSLSAREGWLGGWWGGALGIILYLSLSGLNKSTTEGWLTRFILQLLSINWGHLVHLWFYIYGCFHRSPAWCSAGAVLMFADQKLSDNTR